MIAAVIKDELEIVTQTIGHFTRRQSTPAMLRDMIFLAIFGFFFPKKQVSFPSG